MAEATILDHLGIEDLTPDEKRRLAAFGEALIIVLQTVIDAVKDEEQAA